MHKTHIFDQKNNAKKKRFYWPTYPIFFQTVTGNKEYFFLGLNLSIQVCLSVDEGARLFLEDLTKGEEYLLFPVSSLSKSLIKVREEQCTFGFYIS